MNSSFSKAVISASAILFASVAPANGQSISERQNKKPTIEKDIVRIVGGNGYGFCEITRVGRRFSARVHVAGMYQNSIGTAWIFVDGTNTGQLDGTAATEGGDASFYGTFRAPRHAEVKIDVRDHQVSLRDIGNTPGDAFADDKLVKELTTPAAYQMGTCSTQFE